MPTRKFIHVLGRLRWFLFLIIVILTLVGCSTTGKFVRAYQGIPAHTNEVALLKIQWNLSFIAIVESVDGTPLNKGNRSVVNNTREIELLPGKHDFEVAYEDSNKGHSIRNAPISFVAEAGKTYELHVAPLERSFSTGLRDELIGGHYFWTLWILDAETKSVIAGQPRETPIHWYEK